MSERQWVFDANENIPMHRALIDQMRLRKLTVEEEEPISFVNETLFNDVNGACCFTPAENLAPTHRVIYVKLR